MRYETYKSIESHHNYAVSNLGNVKNIKTGRVLKPQSSKRGGHYLFVNLYNKGVRVNKTIHSLVAEAFLGPRPEGHEIHHKDSDHQNNKWLNLIYIHAAVHRLIKRKAAK